ncbi:MAG TPA: hypothetical protein VL358_01140 [Caulobacteraceae bacterium]|jgi:hypothetical protein|nr:hypothetical protein [Caulobacteraceae bacterium]
MSECASRELWIIAPGEDEPSPLRISFHTPELVEGEDWLHAGLLSIKCAHFEKILRVQGVDSMGALMNMPFMAQAYLSSWRRQGYHLYWFEPGDFDSPSFWGPPPTSATNPRIASPFLRLMRRLKLAPPP